MDIPIKQMLMSTVEVRSEINTWLEELDDDFLAAVHLMVGTYRKQKAAKEEAERLARIAEYEASLKPMTVEELTARAIASDEDIAAGRVHDSEEVRQLLGL